MKKILVPTDFSEPAQKALNYSVNIALKAQAEIMLLNVGKPDAFTNGMAGDLEGISKKTNSQFTTAINNIAQQFTHQLWKQIPISYKQLKGNTVKQVVKTCRTQNIDLLITAAKGNSGWANSFMGNTAKRIIKRVSCPVLTLPKHTPLQPIKRITFATDLSKIGMQAIEQIHNFAQIFEAHFSFVHVILEEKRSYQTQLANFRLMVDEAIGHEHYDVFEVEAKGVVEGLNQYAAQNPIDILAMLRHKRSTLNKLFTISYAETMSSHAEIPILMFSE